jgi:hypothetical protein
MLHILAVFMLSLLTLAILAPLGFVSASAGSELTVTSQDMAGTPMRGYYAVLSLAGNLTGTGFTPVSFALVDGQSYVIQVDIQVASPGDTGSCVFDHWADTGSNDTYRVIAIAGDTKVSAVYNCGVYSPAPIPTNSTVTVNSVDENGVAISGYYVGLSSSGGGEVASGFTPATFTDAIGSAYTGQADGSGACTFSSWSGGARIDPVPFTATNESLSLTAVFNCGGSTGGGGVVSPTAGESGAGPGTITIYDHRVPQSDWAQCFAVVCNAGTGPGASMWVTLYNSDGTVAATGFSNEDGLTFTGLNPSATYYLSPSDCDLCHGSTHDVLFSYWGSGTSGSDTRPLPLIANGTFVDAWYTCTNGCGGV